MTGSGGYRLEALLELRRREEEARRAAFAQAVAEAARARAAVDQARRAAEAARVRREAAREEAAALAASGRATAGDLVAARRFGERLALEETRAREAVQRAEAAARTAEEAEARARDALAAASRDREAIEKHREKWFAERKREMERREEAEQDDRRTGRRD